MKKLSLLLALILAVSLVFCGCSDKNDDKSETKSSKTSESNSQTDGNNEEQTDEDDEGDSNDTLADSDDSDGDFDGALANYEEPAEAKKINTEKEDPSNKSIEFTYDDEGRVKTCTYAVDGKKYVASYKYEGNTAQIYTFYGDTIVADVQIELSDYDPEKGFTTIDGYYFKGYTKK